MPGLIESHGHLTFPSAVGHIDPSFNPPVDVSFFRNIKGMEDEAGPRRAERQHHPGRRVHLGLLGGLAAAMPTEVILRDKIKAGAVPGPRLRAASMERDNHPVRPDGHVEPDWQGPDACRAFVREQAAMGFDSVKFLLSNDDVFIPGGCRSPSTPRRRRPPRASRPASRGSG